MSEDMRTTYKPSYHRDIPCEGDFERCPSTEYYTLKQLQAMGRVKAYEKETAEVEFKKSFPTLRHRQKVVRLVRVDYYVSEKRAWRKARKGEVKDV